MPFETSFNGFSFSLKLVDERVDDASGRDLGETLTTVLKNYYSKIELTHQGMGSATFRVAGRDLFKAEKAFDGFVRQLENQWQQGATKRKARYPLAPKASGGFAAKLQAKPVEDEVDVIDRMHEERHEAAFLAARAEEVPQVEPRLVRLLEAPKAPGSMPNLIGGFGWEACGPAKPEPVPEPEPEPELAPMDEDQQKSYDLILDLHSPGHVFVTGSAGSGKSHLIKHLLASGKCTACATTARAALVIDATTVDRLFCFSRTTWEVRWSDRLNSIMAKAGPIILIDEASMIGIKMMSVLIKVAKYFRKKLVLVGDLAQASPVKDEWISSSEHFVEIVKNGHFIKLTKSHRQTVSPYLTALNSLRSGIVDDNVRDTFRPCLVNGADDVDDQYIRLFATNAATDAYNNLRLQALEVVGVRVSLQTTLSDLRDDHLKNEYPLTDDQIAKHINDGAFAHNESFAIGARVIMTKNEGGDAERYVNGDTGVIQDILYEDNTSVAFETPRSPFDPPGVEKYVTSFVVLLDRLGYPVDVGRTSQALKDAHNREIVGLSGFPIRLGWAISIHKAQGMTVDKAFLDMSSINRMQGDSKHGLAYVGMSRCRDISGLKLSNWSEQAVFCAPVVKQFV